jgi:very-short-patch-repair endonuclease
VLEERFMRLLQRSGTATDAVLHHRIRLGAGPTVEVDVAFPGDRVVVELDGWRYHSAPASFRSDRARDVELAALGWVVLRFTHADVDRRPRWVLDQIRRTRATRRAAMGS